MLCPAIGGLTWKYFSLLTEDEMIRWNSAEEAFKGIPQRLFWGLTHKDLPEYIREGRDFLYVDNPYFNRSAQRSSFRLIRKHVHLTTLLDRPRDRADKFKLTLAPWRKGGADIVVIPPSPFYKTIFGAEKWLDETVAKLLEITDREIRVKYNKKFPLEKYLQNTHAVVTFGSVAGIEAAMMGVPVFSGPICPSLPITAGPLANIETPFYSPLRQEWLNSLAYASWTMDEFAKINKADYNYR